MENEMTTSTTTDHIVIIKRGRGRPKGSGKKQIGSKVPIKVQSTSPSTPNIPINVQSTVPSTNVPDKEMVGVYKVKAPKAKKELKELDPNLILTTTLNGTPIGIYGITKSKNDTFLNVLIRPRDERSSKTIIISTDVVRPIINDVEVAKEFAEIKFYDQPAASEQAIEFVMGNEGTETTETTETRVLKEE